MRKACFIVTLLAFMAACGSNDSKDKKEDSKEVTAQEAPMDPEIEKGLNLVANNTCFQCHDVSVKKIGPAYEAVAEKYQDDPAIIDTLSSRIIKGSVGHWGTVPMTPNSEVSEADAKTMVRYILSLK